MGTSFGDQVLDQIGTSISIIANPNGLRWKVAGITVAWGTVAAVAGADVTVPDSIIIKVGEKYLRHGQVMVEITAVGTTQGQYGPFDPAATDGRQTLGRGRTFLMPTSQLEREVASNYCGVLEGGRVYKERLIATAGAASLAAGPTYAALEGVLPELRYAY
jgi:hypothetical protein